MDVHQSTDNYFGPFLPYSLCDFWISHLEKTSKWHGWKKNSYLQHIYSVYAKCSFLLVLYLVINTAGQIKHLQTFEKQVLLPLLRSVRSKDLSKISYAETCVWLYFLLWKGSAKKVWVLPHKPIWQRTEGDSFPGQLILPAWQSPENKKSYLLELPLSLYRLSMLTEHLF